MRRRDDAPERLPLQVRAVDLRVLPGTQVVQVREEGMMESVAWFLLGVAVVKLAEWIGKELM